jgi:predicted nucleic acid-binding protein
MLIYRDSGIRIYWLDQVGPFHLRAEKHVQALLAAGHRLAITDLTRLECRVGAMKRQDAAVLASFDAFFARPEVVHVPLTAAVFDRATRLRVDLNFKTPDALHLAAAIESGCDRFLTNDLRLSRCTDLPLEVLPP